MRKAIYTSDEEREFLVKTAQSNGEYLIEDAITIDGKYLIFAAAPPEPEPQPPSQEERIEALELAMLDLVLGGGV